MARRWKWSWTPLQLKKADDVLTVANDLRKHWPLTLRQIYYQLVSKGLKLSWGTLEDRTRTVTNKKGYESLEEFIDLSMDSFLWGYSRCLVQGQDKYVEVWTEKDALFRIFNQVVWPYCMRAVVCRGYQSVTFIADFYERAEKAIMKSQTPVVLYFGDLDPSGVQMLEATIENLEDELDLYGVEFKRIGLNPEHIKQYDLPSDPTAAKSSDPRYKKYVQRYGQVAVELDALHPEDHERLDELRYRIMDLIDKEVRTFD